MMYLYSMLREIINIRKCWKNVNKLQCNTEFWAHVFLQNVEEGKKCKNNNNKLEWYISEYFSEFLEHAMICRSGYFFYYGHNVAIKRFYFVINKKT